MHSKISPSDEDGDTSGDKSHSSSIRSKQHDGSGVLVDERLAQTSKTLRCLLAGNRCENFSFCIVINSYRFLPDEAWSESRFGCVLLADISGFTRLSTILSVEQLKHHIKYDSPRFTSS